MNIDHGKDSEGDLRIGFAVADRHKRLSRADMLSSYWLSRRGEYNK